MKPCMYVIANKGLDMSPGKLAAQVGHATIAATFISDSKLVAAWKAGPHRWHIVLEAEDSDQLCAVAHYLSERDIFAHLVCDEGVTEVRPFTYTALGIAIVDKDDPVIPGILGGLRRYRDKPLPAPEADYHWTNYAAPRFLNRRGRRLRDEQSIFKLS